MPCFTLNSIPARMCQQSEVAVGSRVETRHMYWISVITIEHLIQQVRTALLMKYAMFRVIHVMYCLLLLLPLQVTSQVLHHQYHSVQLQAANQVRCSLACPATCRRANLDQPRMFLLFLQVSLHLVCPRSFRRAFRAIFRHTTPLTLKHSVLKVRMRCFSFGIRMVIPVNPPSFDHADGCKIEMHF